MKIKTITNIDIGYGSFIVNRSNGAKYIISTSYRVGSDFYVSIICLSTGVQYESMKCANPTNLSEAELAKLFSYCPHLTLVDQDGREIADLKDNLDEVCSAAIPF